MGEKKREMKNLYINTILPNVIRKFCTQKIKILHSTFCEKKKKSCPIKGKVDRKENHTGNPCWACHLISVLPFLPNRMEAETKLSGSYPSLVICWYGALSILPIYFIPQFLQVYMGVITVSTPATLKGTV